MLGVKLTKDSDRLGTEEILPLLIKLSVPGIIGMSTQSLYNVIDSIYIGRLSKEALSAVSLAFPVQMILIAIGAGTGVGISSLISRLLGQGREDRASNAAGHVMLITLVYGLVFCLLGILWSDELINIFTDNSTLIAMAVEYIRVIMMGSLAIFFPMIANNILRGAGNTFAPMVMLVIGAVLNIILDPFLIFGIGIFPKLGIQGAAVATILSRLIGGIFIAYILFLQQNQIEFSVKKFEFDFQLIKEIYRVGLPAMAMPLSASVMIAGVNKIIAGYSTLAIAVFGIYFRLQSFVFLPIVGLNQGYMPIVGYNYGHKNPERMKKTIKLGLAVSSVFTTIGFITFQLFPQELIQLFNRSPELLEMGVTALKKLTLAFPIMGPALVASATFQAVGKGVPSLIHSVTRQVFFLFPIMYVLGEIYGLDTLWYALPIAEFIAAVGIIIWMVITFRTLFTELQSTSVATENSQ
ncbi:MATE family efflux transporter [Acetohalobium arabaticum]|uniref:MATE efflux family protein n=1 Tax=Acetohalobium arabaticum (strain ATCC 49924 / DSM 5501 / Z-7288) TaxID=574087 RepID=D9QS56_ACEAZ|nr:MATE family efflux transporter [Acetohalobium arabaticum]ADL13347.1 MATE efflux family protein [Acetohalobium arabaticum DSM 5501]